MITLTVLGTFKSTDSRICSYYLALLPECYSLTPCEFSLSCKASSRSIKSKLKWH